MPRFAQGRASGCFRSTNVLAVNMLHFSGLFAIFLSFLRY
jgi:hypothetical protein